MRKMTFEKRTGAFSLIELIISLIVIFCITGAFAPVITKKMKNSNVTVALSEISVRCDKFTEECTLCYSNKCIMCNRYCNENQYKNDATCLCEDCTDRSIGCIRCDEKKCTRCDLGYGLTIDGKCKLCPAGYYSDGTYDCKPCPAGQYQNIEGKNSCINCPVGQYQNEERKSSCITCPSGKYQDEQGKTFCKTCPEDYYCTGGSHRVQCPNSQGANEGSSACTTCSTGIANCNECSNLKECTLCNLDYYLNSSKACIKCPNEYGCNGTATTIPCTNFDSNCANCNFTQCISCKNGFVFNNNRQCVSCIPGSKEFTSAGTFEFEIPNGCKTITATLVAGGGGGGAGSIKESTANFKTVGTNNWTIPQIAKNKYFKLYSCGGGGAGSSTGCGGATDNEWHTNMGGYGGFVNGILRTMPNQSTLQVIVGAGGGIYSGYHYPGKGGGATYISNYASDPQAVAGGGSGGGCTSATNGRCYNSGAGGGASTSNGGASVAGCCYNVGQNGKPTNINAMTSYFGSLYCAPGIRTTPCCDCSGVAGKQGYLRILYPSGKSGGSGGASGAIVPKQTISASGKLIITVGAGGKGGTAGTGYNSAGAFINSTNGLTGGQSLIKNSSGTILLQTATGNMSGSGGIATGQSAKGGAVTNGKNNTAISVNGYSSGQSSATTTTTGSAGGVSTINGVNPCAGGAASNANGNNATGYGGCGGGGGGAGYNGGNGAPGYVKIEWSS